MRGHAEARDILHLERDIGVDQVVGEHAATGEELAVLIIAMDRSGTISTLRSGSFTHSL